MKQSNGAIHRIGKNFCNYTLIEDSYPSSKQNKTKE